MSSFPFDAATESMIAAELQRASEAMATGNAGMARVCCRRASGAALTVLGGETTPEQPFTTSAMRLLDLLSESATAPAPVRDAARRLRAKAVSDGSRDQSRDPIADARTIIGHVREAFSMRKPPV